MFIHVALVGGPDHPRGYHVNLPTYTMVGEPDYDNRCVVVSVPNETLPPNAGDHALEFGDCHLTRKVPTYNEDGHVSGEKEQTLFRGDVLHGHGPDFIDAWVKHLDERYKEHQGEYNPEVKPLNG